MDNTNQAHPPSDAEQLRDARTANGLLRVRLAEQEALVAQYRARGEALEAQGQIERQVILSLLQERAGNIVK